MRGLLGEDEAIQLERSLAAESAAGLRVNTLKLSAPAFERLSPWRLEPVPWCPTGYLVPQAERPGLHPYHAAGLYYLQEPSAMAVAQVLAPRPGELVLDLAAAPGGKSTHLAALMASEGVLVANDVNTARARELSRNLERWGTSRSLITSSAPAELARAWGPIFDAVLLDAPCSGEGMFRKAPQAVDQWTPELVASCAFRQDALLQEAANLVKPGGRLVYSTCTFEPEENERVMARFLESRGDWETGRAELPGVDQGRPEWAIEFRRNQELSRTARLWPHRSVGEGHFIALLKRSPGSLAADPATGPAGEMRRRNGGKRARPETDHARASWQAFVSDNLENDPLPEHVLNVRSDGLYGVPPGAPPLEGLRVLRPGVWLGKQERGRFVPSHALALAIETGVSARSVDLEPDDPRLLAYLQGAELEVPGEDGWVVVAVSGHPLGWGRRARDIVKNHYPKGLRRSN